MDTFNVSAPRSAGLRMSDLYVHHDAALRARGLAKHGKAVWVSIARTLRAADRRAAAENGVGEFCRRGVAADASRSHAGRTCPLVRPQLQLDVDYGSSRWKAGSPQKPRDSAGRSAKHVDQPESQCTESLDGARYAGTVMFEGTTLSEGRGTTPPLELFGAPDLDAQPLLTACTRSRRSGCTAVGFACAGSNPHSTSMSASSALACRFTWKTRATITRHFVPGASKHSRSKHFGSSTPISAVAGFPFRFARPIAIDVINGSSLLHEG